MFIKCDYSQRINQTKWKKRTQKQCPYQVQTIKRNEINDESEILHDKTVGNTHNSYQKHIGTLSLRRRFRIELYINIFMWWVVCICSSIVIVVFCEFLCLFVYVT